MNEAYNISSIDKLESFLNSKQAIHLAKVEYDALDEFIEIYNEVRNLCFKEEASDLISELMDLEKYFNGFAVQNIIKTTIRDLTHKAKILPTQDNANAPMNIRCSYCSSEMELRFSRYGSFYSCPYHFGVTRKNNY